MSRLINIKWRQGDILSVKDLSALKPTLNLPERLNINDCLAITISHSCDIANNNDEPTIEFICSNITGESNGNYINAKNPRILHLPIAHKSETLQLIANQKFEISKVVLMDYNPDQYYVLNQDQKNILQNWLSARYKRHAFPDALNERLMPLKELLEKQGKKNANNILGYWIDYDPRNDELEIGQPYDFSLYIIYSTDNPEFGETEAQAVASQIKEKFTTILQNNTHLGSVHLLKCEAYSEEEFTIKDLRRNIQYRFEYLSHKTNPHGPVVDY